MKDNRAASSIYNTHEDKVIRCRQLPPLPFPITTSFNAAKANMKICNRLAIAKCVIVLPISSQLPSTLTAKRKLRAKMSVAMHASNVREKESLRPKPPEEEGPRSGGPSISEAFSSLLDWVSLRVAVDVEGGVLVGERQRTWKTEERITKGTKILSSNRVAMRKGLKIGTNRYTGER